MAHLSRRAFVRTGLAAGALASTGSLSLQALQASAAKKSATDWVTLGDSGVKVTRLAFGTGSMSGAVQRSLGQEAFTKTVRYAPLRQRRPPLLRDRGRLCSRCTRCAGRASPSREFPATAIA